MASMQETQTSPLRALVATCFAVLVSSGSKQGVLQQRERWAPVAIIVCSGTVRRGRCR